MLRQISVFFLAILALAGPALAADKGIRFWNLTSATIAKFYMAPAGTNNYGPNQCENDRDGTVDHDERLKITGITGGKFDIKLAYEDGKVCIAKDISVKDGGVFSLEDKNLSCNR
eukprot:gene13786-13902_t